MIYIYRYEIYVYIYTHTPTHIYIYFHMSISYWFGFSAEPRLLQLLIHLLFQALSPHAPTTFSLWSSFSINFHHH